MKRLLPLLLLLPLAIPAGPPAPVRLGGFLPGRSASPEAFQIRFDGELAAGDLKLKTAEFYDVYSLRVASGARLRVVMTSDAFDTYLIVNTPDGEQEDNDDSGGSDRSELFLTMPEAGTAKILATSYAPGATGRYTILATFESPEAGR